MGAVHSPARRVSGRVTPAWHAWVMSTHGVAISLFSGAGGLDLGVDQAGFTTTAAVEVDNDAADTMEKNFPGLASPVIRRSILDVTTTEILHAAGLRDRERPDLLVGGPPCTPFSKSGFHLEWKREGLDPDASLLQAYTRVLAEAKPRAFVLENVYALTYNNKASKPAFTRLLREITGAGYDYRWEVLNAADYGVPQARPRLFVVGVRRGGIVAASSLSCPDPPITAHGSAAPLVGPTAVRTSPPGRRSTGCSPIQRPKRSSAASGATSSPASRPAGITCTTPSSAATPSPSSSGAADTGRSCSSSIRPSPPRRSRRSPDRTSDRSTGTAAASACPS